jgi:hypothetical protein
MLSVVAVALFGSRIGAAADTQQNVQDLQKKLNAEVLSQPFSVPDLRQIRLQQAEVEARQAKLRQYIHPRWHDYPVRLDLGWHYHHGRHRYGYHHQYYRHY